MPAKKQATTPSTFPRAVNVEEVNIILRPRLLVLHQLLQAAFDDPGEVVPSTDDGDDARNFFDGLAQSVADIMEILDQTYAKALHHAPKGTGLDTAAGGAR